MMILLQVARSTVLAKTSRKRFLPTKTHDMGAMIVGAAVRYRDEVADGSLVRRGDSNTQYSRVQH